MILIVNNWLIRGKLISKPILLFNVDNAQNMHKILICIRQVLWFTHQSSYRMGIKISQSNQPFHLHHANSQKYYIVSARVCLLKPHLPVSNSPGKLPISWKWYIQWILQGGGWVEVMIQPPTSHKLPLGTRGRKICWFGAYFWPFWGCEGVSHGHRWVI